MRLVLFFLELELGSVELLVLCLSALILYWMLLCERVMLHRSAGGQTRRVVACGADLEQIFLAAAGVAIFALLSLLRLTQPC